jgi:acetyl esterase
VQSFTITARDGHELPVRSYILKVTTSSHVRQLLIYLHVGGFLFGDVDSRDMNCRILSCRLGISILNVSYQLAPAWKYPHGLDDSYDATARVSFFIKILVLPSPFPLSASKKLKTLPSIKS